MIFEWAMMGRTGQNVIGGWAVMSRMGQFDWWVGNDGQNIPCSVPVIWARMRNERDWEVPVRGRQSSVSSISRFLLASLWDGTW